MSRRRRAIIALTLLVPAPTIGTLCGMLIPGLAGTPLGQGIYLASKVWIVLVPIVWWILFERSRPRLARPPADRRRGLLVGAGLGLLISAIIVGAYVAFGHQLIDPDGVRAAAERSGLAHPVRFIALAIYISSVNAIIEEFVWRWFVFRRCEELLSRGHGIVAVLLSALLFTVHHVFALAAQFGWEVTLLGSLGVFIGGAVWSWCYLRFRSIWPGYVSHAIVDVAIFAVGWAIIFGL